WEVENANLKEFVTFMDDRSAIELMKATFGIYIGEVTGEATPGALGLHPGKK
ncbi:TPA: hypothetical protein N0F65_011313, partial [Lagenidium giganteum]